jgi:hypothetical protein
MSVLNREEIERLVTRVDGPRVSIYLPTHRTSPEMEQDPIRFKNLLNRAKRGLVDAGVRSVTAQKWLAPARKLLHDLDFWLHQSDGLAVFVASDGMSVYRLTHHVRELTAVEHQFYLNPLLPLLSSDARFYILALSLNKVRLFEASRDVVREIDLHDIPESLRDAVGYDWEESTLQFHTGGVRGVGGGRHAMFHGQGAPRDDEKAEIATFLRLVDNGVMILLARERAPLVLAAVDYLIPIYREVSDYPHILGDAIEGNPDRRTAQELHQHAWLVVQPRLRAQQREAAGCYEALAGTGRASSDLREVVGAAFDGRVATVFVALGVRRWGTFDPGSRRLIAHDLQEPGDQDLLDILALQSLVCGADVYAVPSEQVPGGGEVAAVFRF